MSLARIYTTKKSRKIWTCSSCGTTIPVGSPVISFTVGFRGIEQRRCADKPGCYPKPSERESSLVSSIYAAQEDLDLSSLDSVEDVQSALEDVANVCDEVASEYESNEMYDINPDLQERAEMIRSAEDELRNWEPDSDEPETTEGEMSEDDLAAFAQEHEDWLDEIRASAQEVVDSIELP
jgi:hypothetical protein